MTSAKRGFDIVFSILGLIFLVPLIPAIGLLIKMDSRGPVFYPVDRVGKNGVPFKMYKFRTMVETPFTGYSVCAHCDPRVTFFGRFLRRTKLNEIPQLFNILMGQMTFVGPRPEAPDLAEHYSREAREVFTVTPGLVSPASIVCRNEEECYPAGVDEKKYYLEHILPGKLQLDLAYIRNQSFFKDIRLVFDGMVMTIAGAISKKHLNDNKSQIALFAADLCIILFAYILMVAFVEGGGWPHHSRLPGYVLFSVFALIIHAGSNFYFGMYNSLIRYISFTDVKNVTLACVCSALTLSFSLELLNYEQIEGLMLLNVMILLTVLLAGLRMGLRFYWEKRRRATADFKAHKVLLYGANDRGYLASRMLAPHRYGEYELVGYLDDDRSKFGKKINGTKVLGNRFHIKDLAKLYHIEEILIAVDDVKTLKLDELIRICRDANIKCRMLPGLKGCPRNGGCWPGARELQLSDTLPLKSFCDDMEKAKELFFGKTVLINGAGSELGTELARRVLSAGCKQLVIMDRYEAYLNRTIAAIHRYPAPNNVSYALMENGAEDLTAGIFKQHRPEIVFHLSIRKYEPQFNNGIDFFNNKSLTMTMNLAKLASDSQATFFVVISSFQNGHGCFSPVKNHLRRMEKTLIRYFSDKSTLLVIPQLCDIAENRGGVLHTLEEQIVNQMEILLPSVLTSCDLISKATAVAFIFHAMFQVRHQSGIENIWQCDLGWRTTLIELAQRAANFHGINPLADLKIRIMTLPEDRQNQSGHLSTQYK